MEHFNIFLPLQSMCVTDCACINRAVGIKVIHTKNPIQFDFWLRLELG